MLHYWSIFTLSKGPFIGAESVLHTKKSFFVDMVIANGGCGGCNTTHPKTRENSGKSGSFHCQYHVIFKELKAM